MLHITFSVSLYFSFNFSCLSCDTGREAWRENTSIKSSFIKYEMACTVSLIEAVKKVRSLTIAVLLCIFRFFFMNLKVYGFEFLILMQIKKVKSKAENLRFFFLIIQRGARVSVVLRTFFLHTITILIDIRLEYICVYLPLNYICNN